MINKLKASELFVKLMVNSQFAMLSEDNNLTHRIAENHLNISNDVKKILEDISMSNEYMRISMIKASIITLVELGIVEGDIDITDPQTSKDLISKAMDIFEKTKASIHKQS